MKESSSCHQPRIDRTSGRKVDYLSAIMITPSNSLCHQGTNINWLRKTSRSISEDTSRESKCDAQSLKRGQANTRESIHPCQTYKTAQRSRHKSCTQNISTCIQVSTLLSRKLSSLQIRWLRSPMIKYESARNFSRSTATKYKWFHRVSSQFLRHLSKSHLS